MNGFKMVVDGFVFTDEKTAKKACQEEESIQYVKDRLDMENPRMVLEMYHKLVAEQVFETPVGLMYLKDLQNYLLMTPELADEDITAIVLPEMAGVNKPREDTAEQPKTSQDNVVGQPETQKAMTPQAAARRQETLEWYAEKLEESRQQERLSDYRRRRAEERAETSRKHLRYSLLLCLFLILVTIGVGAITMTDSHPNIINYENKLIEKYQNWEADLESREQALKDREAEMNP